jgi:hypothetical protein
MVLKSDGILRSNKSEKDEDVNGAEKPSSGMGPLSGAMQSAPQQPKFETKEQERKWVKFRLIQGLELVIFVVENHIFTKSL